MIHCPYCGSEMSDDATHCPQCLSLLVEEMDRKVGTIPRWAHPFTVLFMVVLMSAGLLAVNLSLGRDEAKKAGHAAKPGVAEAGSRGTAPAKKPGESPGSVPEKPGGEEVQVEQDEYVQLLDYENTINGILDQAESFDRELRDMSTSKEKSNIGKFGEKLRQFQYLTTKTRNIEPPARIRRAHTRLANSFAIRQRGYRNMMLYMQSGEMNRIQKARDDLATAEKQERIALEEIENLIERLAPPPPEPEPPPEEEPLVPLDEGPAEEEAPEEPAPAEEELSPVEGSTLQAGDTLYIEEGDTVYLEEGETLYPDEGSTLYPGEEGTYDEYYPEDYPPEEEMPY